MRFDPPLYAVQWSAIGHCWIVRAPDDDPLTPAVRVVAVVEAPENGPYAPKEPVKFGSTIQNCGLLPENHNDEV